MNEKEKTTSKYSRETLVEAGLNLIPYVGGSIATLYASNKQQKEFERIESFYDEVASKIKLMDHALKTILNKQIHDDESLVNLIESINDIVEKENQDIKKQYLQNLFINSLLNRVDGNTLDQRKYFLDALSNLTVYELEVISLLYKEDRLININEIRMHGHDNRYAVLGFVNRLRNFGFVEQYIGDEFHVGAIDNSLNANIKISSFGKEFVNFCLL